MEMKQIVKDFLKGQISTFMYMDIDEIEDDELFSNFGLESTTLVKIIANICEEFGVSLEVREILEHQTVSKASAFVCEKLTENIQQD